MVVYDDQTYPVGARVSIHVCNLPGGAGSAIPQGLVSLNDGAGGDVGKVGFFQDASDRVPYENRCLWFRPDGDGALERVSAATIVQDKGYRVRPRPGICVEWRHGVAGISVAKIPQPTARVARSGSSHS